MTAELLQKFIETDEALEKTEAKLKKVEAELEKTEITLNKNKALFKRYNKAIQEALRNTDLPRNVRENFEQILRSI